MKIVQIPILLLLLIVAGCQGEKNTNSKSLSTRNCDCPLEETVDQKITRDSSFSKTSEDDLFDWSIDGKISTKIKKYLDLELKAKGESISDYDISTKNIVTKLDSNYPDLTNEIYYYKTGRLFYCAYFNLVCQDTSISNNELTKLSVQKLDDFHNDIKKLIRGKIADEKKSKPKYNTPTTKKTPQKNKSNNEKEISIEGNNNNTNQGNNNTIDNRKIQAENFIDKQIIQPTERLVPKIVFFDRDTREEMDTINNQVKTSLFFGSDQGVLLKNVGIFLRFKEPIKDANWGFVGSGGSTGFSEIKFGSEKKSLTFMTTKIDPTFAARIQIFSKKRLEILEMRAL